VVPRGQQATVSLDGSTSTSPGSSITRFEWRINGVVKSEASFVTLQLGAVPQSYSIELQVTNADGLLDRATATVSVSEAAPPPVVLVLNPSNLRASSSLQSFSVVGTDFVSGGRVSIRSPSAVETTLSSGQVSVVSSTLINAQAIFDAAGDWNVQVINPDGARSNSVVLSVGNQTPAISGLSPSPLLASRGPQRIQLAGSGFRSGLTVYVTTPSQVLVVTGSRLDSVASNLVAFSLDLGGVAASYYFVIQNPDGQSSNQLRVDAVSIDPTISSVSPTTLIGTGSPQSLKILGQNFISSSSVLVRDVRSNQTSAASVAVTSPTEITASYSFPAAASDWTVQVVNPDGGRSGQVPITVLAPPPPSSPPTVASVTPSFPPNSPSPQHFTVSGAGFRPGSGFVVRLLNVATGQDVNVTNFTTATTASVQFDAAVTTLGTWSAQVINPDGAASNAVPFLVVSTPSIASVTPSAALVDNSWQTITVSGTGFESVNHVNVVAPDGTLRDTQVSNVTATTFTFDVYMDVIGSWSMRALVPGGGASAAFAFTSKLPPPVITGTSTPTYGTGVQQLFGILGKNFDANAVVVLRNTTTGLSTNAPIQAIARTTISVYATFDRQGGPWTVEVINPDGSRSGPFAFTVIAPITPVIMGITPLTANSVAQGMTISGSGFVAIPSITFFKPTGQAVPFLRFTTGISSTSIGIAALIDVPGTWGVQVTNPDGSQSAVFKFNVAAP
jgi:hypothetical protein